MIKISLVPICSLILCFFFVCAPSAHAQPLMIVHNFEGGVAASDGSAPQAPLVQGSDGNFYGTTFNGGTSGDGTVFRVSPAGTVTILHSFSGDSSFVNSDGAYPCAGLVQGSDGDFYGTAFSGGTAGGGTVFKITATGLLTTLVSFDAFTGGAEPNGGLVQGGDGDFYGTTVEGGYAPRGGTSGGTIFKVTPSGIMTALHDFGDGSVANDGSEPFATLIRGSDGSLYGTTASGGAAGHGTVFRMTLSGTVTILHSFGDGSVANDGSTPVVALTLGSDGNPYGTTSAGGAANLGVAFKITASGSVTILHSFGDGTVAADGSVPNALTQDADGNFYGTAYTGGATGSGVAFRMTPAGAVTILHSFGDGTVSSDGLYPDAAFALAGDGSLWGTTQFGGSARKGTVFRLPGAGALVWTAQDAAAAPDGTARLLWTRSDGAARLWSMSASNAQVMLGPIYGPYPGWSATKIAAAADGTSRVLWTSASGQAGVWVFSADDAATVVGPAYGPYPGWSAAKIATAPDGASRLLWTRSDGAAGVWTLNASGIATMIGAVYGPFPEWTAKSVGAAGDGTARILWSRSDGAAGVWTLNALDTVQEIGAAYGPYSDSHGVWSATNLCTSSDGTSQVLWNRTDGAVGLWTFSAANTPVTVGPVYAPSAGYTATAFSAASDQARVLWTRADRAAQLVSFGPDDTETVSGPIYGPY